MVDTGTWGRLDDAGRQEFQSLSARFHRALRDAGVHDGYDLAMTWSVQEIDGAWAISDGAAILDGVTSPRRDVIDALYADGVQNLNR